LDAIYKDGNAHPMRIGSDVLLTGFGDRATVQWRKLGVDLTIYALSYVVQARIIEVPLSP